MYLLLLFSLYSALEITGHSEPIIVGLSGTINCSTLLNVSKLEWFIGGIKELSESREGTKFVTLTFTPQTTAWNGTSITCRATTHNGGVYEESVDIAVKGMVYELYVIANSYVFVRIGAKAQVLVDSTIISYITIKHNG
jgi:hypothetical protein